MHTTTRIRPPRHQQGAVLFIALVFLVLIMLLTLTATSTSILQEKMTGGLRNQQLSAMGTDSALRGGEAWVWSLDYKASQPLPPCVPGGTGTCVHRPQRDGLLTPEVQKFRTYKGWLGTPQGSPGYLNALIGLTGTLASASLATQPVLMIEDMGPNVPPGVGRQTGAIDSERTSSAGRLNFYRITARSQGGNAASLKAMESVISTIDLTNTGITDEL